MTGTQPFLSLSPRLPYVESGDSTKQTWNKLVLPRKVYPTTDECNLGGRYLVHRETTSYFQQVSHCELTNIPGRRGAHQGFTYDPLFSEERVFIEEERKGTMVLGRIWLR